MLVAVKVARLAEAIFHTVMAGLAAGLAVRYTLLAEERRTDAGLGVAAAALALSAWCLWAVYHLWHDEGDGG